MNLYAGVLAACIIWGSVPFFAKRFMVVSTSTEVFMFFTSLSFFMWMSVILICTSGPTKEGRWHEIKSYASHVPIAPFLAWSLAGSVIAATIYYQLLKEHPTYLVVALTSITPLFAAAIGYLFFGETLTIMHMGGVLCIVLGIALFAIKPNTP